MAEIHPLNGLVEKVVVFNQMKIKRIQPKFRDELPRLYRQQSDGEILVDRQQAKLCDKAQA